MPKLPSKPQRWMDAAGRAEQALNELLEVQSEYESWKDGLPENLQQTALGEKLEAVCELDIQAALDTIQEAQGIDLPRGFGRD